MSKIKYVFILFVISVSTNSCVDQEAVGATDVEVLRKPGEGIIYEFRVSSLGGGSELRIKRNVNKANLFFRELFKNENFQELRKVRIVLAGGEENYGSNYLVFPYQKVRSLISQGVDRELALGFYSAYFVANFYLESSNIISKSLKNLVTTFGRNAYVGATMFKDDSLKELSFLLANYYIFKDSALKPRWDQCRKLILDSFSDPEIDSLKLLFILKTAKGVATKIEDKDELIDHMILLYHKLSSFPYKSERGATRLYDVIGMKRSFEERGFDSFFKKEKFFWYEQSISPKEELREIEEQYQLGLSDIKKISDFWNVNSIISTDNLTFYLDVDGLYATNFLFNFPEYLEIIIANYKFQRSCSVEKRTYFYAHEFSHFIQNRVFDSLRKSSSNDFSSKEENKFIELEADFFAGIYLNHPSGGNFSTEQKTKCLELIKTFGDDGDGDDDDPHGTGLERESALAYGFELASTLDLHDLNQEKLFSLKALFRREF